MHVSEIALLGMLGAAVVTDVRTGKIKNWLTLPAIVLGPFLNLLEGGKQEALLSLAGLGVMIAVAAVLMSLKMFGGGDAKLLVAVGSLAGLPIVKDSLLFTAIAGGVLAIAAIVRRRRAAAVGEMARAAWMKLGLGVSCPETFGGRTKIPYSVAIAAGTAVAVFWRP